MTDNMPAPNVDGDRKSPATSLRTQLLLALNLAVIITLGIFVFWDYKSELRAAAAQKKASLDEEAGTLQALLSHHSNDPKEVQRYIDAVCVVMRDTTSPGHHIAVKLNGDVLQSSAHHRPSARMVEWMTRAAAEPDGVGQADKGEIVVGRASDGRPKVYVSEYLFNVRRDVRRQAWRRVAGIVVLAVVLGLVVSYVAQRLVARPLMGVVEAVRKIGNGQLGARAPRAKAAELDFLVREFNRMSSDLERVAERRQAGMDRARRIQRNLLPDLDSISGLRVGAVYEPAEDVAGDYYDVISIPGDGLFLCVADVSGHGVPGAMGAAMLKAVVETHAARESDPGRLLALLDAAYSGVSLDDDFATMMIAHWKPRSARISYASAGHEPAFLLRSSGETGELDSTGMPLGIADEGTEWKTMLIDVSHGDRLVIFTDGLPEMHSPDGKLFGRERLLALLDEHRQASIEDITRVLRDAITAHCGSRRPLDDITILIADF